MKVLIACEFSGTVRDAFSALGHDATSCDILPTEKPGKHYQGDVRDIISQGWDLMIAHPPCTYLCLSGMHWTSRGLRDKQFTEDALDFVRFLMSAPIDRIAIENPIGIISSRIRPPDCIIQPYDFGHPDSKKTCFWLKNLPPLKPTKILPMPPSRRWSNQSPSGNNNLAPTPDRWKKRSLTYPSIAEAMASQWGNPNYPVVEQLSLAI